MDIDFLTSAGRGVLGLVGIIAIAFLLSSDKKRINWRTVGAGLGLQLLFAVLFLKGEDLAQTFAPFGWPRAGFAWVAGLFVKFLSAVEAGATFIFGTLALSPGSEGSLGFFFFAYVLPTVIVFASLMSVLYYLGIMQWIVRGVSWVVRRALGTSGPESLSVSANIFVGQTEAPLVIKPYIKNLSRSELMAVMTGGMATIAGGVLASYVAFLGERYASVAGIAVEAGQQLFAEQLLGASVMAAPAALVLAKILIPETKPVNDSLAPEATVRPASAVAVASGGLPDRDVLPVTDAGEATLPATSSDEAQEAAVEALADEGPKNIIDAAATGAADGMQLALNIGAMLIAFLALIAIINGTIGWGVELFGGTIPEGKGALEIALGYILAPIAWLVGVPNSDLLDIRRVARDEGDRQRVRGLQPVRGPAGNRHARSQNGRHGDVRALRVRQPLLHRHPDRRHRASGAGADGRDREPGPAGRSRGHACQPDDGHHRGRAPGIRGIREGARGLRCLPSCPGHLLPLPPRCRPGLPHGLRVLRRQRPTLALPLAEHGQPGAPQARRAHALARGP